MCGVRGLRLTTVYADVDVVTVLAEISKAGARGRILTIELVGGLAPEDAERSARFDADANSREHFSWSAAALLALSLHHGPTPTDPPSR